MADAFRSQMGRWCAAALALLFGFIIPASAEIAQQGSKLTPNGAIGSFLSFGKAVAVSADGNTAIVGSPEEDTGAGGARVFVRGNGSWSQQSLRLFPNDGNNMVGAGPSFGNAVALSADGNIAFIAGRRDNVDSGAVWVFTRTNGAWSQLGSKLTPNDATPFANFGHSIASSSDGNTIIVGGNNDNNNMGAAWIFTRSGNTWSQQGSKLKPNIGAASRFGHSVALSSDGLTAIVGEPFRSISGVFGAAWVFVPISGTWVQQGNVLLPNDVSNVAFSPSFGYSVAMSADGNLAVIGGPTDGEIGAAWIFTRNSNGGWNQSGGKLVSGDTGIFTPQFGNSVAVSADGKTALIGEYAYSLAPNAHTGAAWLFTQNNGSWTKQGNRLAASDGNGPDFGTSVALSSSDANTALVGGPFDSTSFGAVFVFVQTPTVSGVTPSSGVVGGGTAVTITGSGFTGASAVKFGDIDAAAFTVVDPNTITATAPPHSGGTIDVRVTNSIGTGTLAGAFRYFRPTVITLGSSPNPARSGQNVTFTAKINNSSATGTVTFKDGSSTLGSVIVHAGVATLKTKSLAVGNHSITATYGGDAVFGSSASSTIMQAINKGATTTTVTATPAAAKSGQSVTLKALVSVVAPASGTVNGGQVSFRDNGVVLANVTVTNGHAQLPVVLKVGSHSIRAVYSGDANLLTSAKSTAVIVAAAVGTETKVNATTANAQLLPVTARLKSGYLIAWVSDKQDGSGLGIFARRYSAAGAAASREIQVTTATAGDQTFPAAAGLSDGSFVIVWQSPGDGSSNGIYGQRFSPAGAKLGAQFRVNTTTAGDQTLPAVTVLANKDFVVTWTSKEQDGSGQGVYARRFKANGVAVGREFKVNTTTAGDQSNPSIAALGTGFVIAWQGPDKAGLGIFGQRFDVNSKPVGSEFRANAVIAKNQSLPKVATLKTGNFVIVWQSLGQDGSGFGIYSQLFTSAGLPSGASKRVTTTTTGNQGSPSVSAFTDAGFVVTWSSPDGSGLGVYAQAFNDGGTAVDAEIRVNAVTAGTQYQSSVTAFSQGNFIAAWTGVDASGTGILAQRFQVPVQ